jgi:hypothetical protein
VQREIVRHALRLGDGPGGLRIARALAMTTYRTRRTVSSDCTSCQLPNGISCRRISVRPRRRLCAAAHARVFPVPVGIHRPASSRPCADPGPGHTCWYRRRPARYPRGSPRIGRQAGGSL